MEERARHLRIREILEHAYDLQGDTRAAYVAEQCGDDLELQREIDGYLTETTAAVEGPSVDAIGWVTSLIQGQHDGGLCNYRLDRILGVGSYGVVYLAEQQEPVRRAVAGAAGAR